MRQSGLRQSPILLAALLLALSATGAAAAIDYPGSHYNLSNIDLSDINRTYHFAVNITVSADHKPSYITVFDRPGNFTINYSVTSGAGPGTPPTPPYPQDLHYDVIRHRTAVALDPRSCQNDLAYCYQVVEHRQPKNLSQLPRGANFTALSAYTLPSLRIRTFVCVGNDTACARSATYCFCPKEQVTPPPVVKGEAGKCDDTQHLCRATYGTFVLCDGNLSSCQQRYPECGCGPQAACVSTMNTCINNRNVLFTCQGTMAACLGKYNACFCGPDMMAFQRGCTTTTHRCTTGDETTVCNGLFSACALGFDKCDC